MKYALLLLMLFLTSEIGVARSLDICSRRLLNPTDAFIAYLASLVEEDLIRTDDLTRFFNQLKKNEITNPITETQMKIVIELHEPYLEFQEYLKSSDLDLKVIFKWTQEKLGQRNQIKYSRDETQNETKNPYREMVFYPIPRGEFMMGKKRKEKKVILIHDIEMMSTKVTQKMWMDIMGVNPSHFKGDLDLPVENITWWSTLVYANRLSEKRGLKPAYDLTGIQWKAGTAAEFGTLKPDGPDDYEAKSTASNILIHNRPNVYETEGYRLPTEAEAEYVRRNLGQSSTLYHFGDSEEELEKYAWFDKNSGKQTHPVAEKLPLIINGNPFYDLLGLVYEWCWDWHDEKLQGGVNPQGPLRGVNRIMRGGSWRYRAFSLRSKGHSLGGPQYRSDDTGLRLVRTLFKK